MTARIATALLFICSVCGCDGDSITISESPALAGRLHEVGILSRPRYQHFSTLLPNGKVLIAGGWAELPAVGDDPSYGGTLIWRPTDLLVSAEIFDAESGTSMQTGDMSVGRYADRGILLSDGRVLVIPTLGVFPIEIYDPATGRFDAVAEVPYNTDIATATLLPSGEVFFTALQHTGVFDTKVGAFASIFEMEETRVFHTATLLKDGRVLIVGRVYNGGESGLVGRNQIYDPPTKAFSEAGELQFDRNNHKAVLLQDGRVLIIGGMKVPQQTYVQTAELYDPETNAFSPAGVSTADPSAALLLKSGSVLLISIDGNIVLYNPNTQVFSPTGHSIGRWRHGAMATLLDDGRVMIAGGWRYKQSPTQDGHESVREMLDHVLVFTP